MLAQALTGTASKASDEARSRATQALDALRANARHEEARAVESWLAEHD